MQGLRQRIKCGHAPQGHHIYAEEPSWGEDQQDREKVSFVCNCQMTDTANSEALGCICHNDVTVQVFISYAMLCLLSHPVRSQSCSFATSQRSLCQANVLRCRLKKMEQERLKEAAGDNLDKEEKKKKKRWECCLLACHSAHCNLIMSWVDSHSFPSCCVLCVVQHVLCTLWLYLVSLVQHCSASKHLKHLQRLQPVLSGVYYSLGLFALGLLSNRFS